MPEIFELNLKSFTAKHLRLVMKMTFSEELVRKNTHYLLSLLICLRNSSPFWKILLKSGHIIQSLTF
jgi:hypothetical protein